MPDVAGSSANMFAFCCMYPERNPILECGVRIEIRSPQVPPYNTTNKCTNAHY